MLVLKRGVTVGGLVPEMILALMVAEGIYTKYGYDCVVTSARDGRHARNSRHYIGAAVDLRTHQLHQDVKSMLIRAVVGALSPQFYVALEYEGTENEHLHIQFNGSVQGDGG